MAEININNTSYNVTEDWLKVAAEYFNIDQSSTQSINMLKAGLFGYNNEIQSNEIKNNVYHRNILYDEHFINTASFPESINNFAKLYNIPINTATPAHLNAVLTINKNDILTNQYLESEEVETELGIRYKNNKLLLNNTYVFNLEGIQFRLPYPIRFDIRYEGGKPTITARYEVNEDNIFPYMKTTNRYLKTWTETMVGSDEDYLLVSIDLYQLAHGSSLHSITNDDLVDSLYINKDFNDQLAFVEVYYTMNGETTKLIVEDNDKIIGDKIIYLSIIDDNTFQLYFSSNVRGFKPEIGSELRIDYYTTLGQNGNFSYSGTISANFNNNGEFDKIPILITPISDSSGGKNVLSLDEMKNKIIEAALTRNSYITDKDLEYYFNNFNASNNINGSQISFIKKRNDLLKRSFSGYLLLRDQEGKVLPTNTASEIYIPNDYSKTERINSEGNIEYYYRNVINEGESVLSDNIDGEIKFYLYNNNKIATDGQRFKLFTDTNNWNWYYTIGEIRTFEDGNTPGIEKIPMVIRTKYVNEIWVEGIDEPQDGIIEIRYGCNEFGIINRLNNIEYYIDENGILRLCKGLMDEDSIIYDEIKESYQGYTEFNNYGLVNYMGNIAVCSLSSRDNYADSFDSQGLLAYYNEENDNNNVFNINIDLFEENDRFTLYSIPYTIKLIKNKQPLKSRYYSMLTSGIYSTSTNYINTAITNKFIITYLSVEKEYQTYTYNFKLELTTNAETTSIDEYIEIRAIIYNKNDIPLGFIKFNRVSDSFVYEASLSSNIDALDEYDKLFVTGSYRLEDNPDSIHTEGTGMDIDDEIKMDIAVFFKNDIDNSKNGYYSEMSGGVSDSDTKFEKSTTAVIYQVDNPIRMFRKLENYMESNFIQVGNKEYDLDEEKFINVIGTKNKIPLSEMENDYYILKDVPLVEYDYYNKYYSQLNKLTNEYHNKVESILDLLENNNTMNIKFYNTYGPSKYWTKYNVQTDMDEPVANIATRLNFIIHTSKVVTDSEDLVIKTFISNFIESCNKNKVFAMSNLLRALENNFDYILYVEFGTLDGDEIQKIINQEKEPWNMSIKDIVNYVPEYLNVKKHVSHVEEEIDYGGDTYHIYHIYEYAIDILYK